LTYNFISFPTNKILLSQNGSIYVFGWQLVEGSTAKDYQKTETRLNIPRLDYSNGTCPSLLVEPQRTNSIVYSQDITNVMWADAGGTATANTAISPDGTQNADTLTGARYQGGGSSNTWTFSCYAKKVNGDNKFLLRLDVPTTNYAQFDLNTGIIDFVSSGYNATITAVENGWYRCTLTTPPSTSIANIVLVSANGGTYSTYVWGAQIEVGNYASSYIPTTSASVTRNADVISKTGISSLIGQTEGTLFYDGYFGNNSSEVYIFLQASGSGGVDNSIYLQKNANPTIGVKVFSGPTQIANINGGSFSVGDRIKIAAAYKANDFVLYINGTQIGTDTSGTPPTCANFNLGNYAGAPTNEDFLLNKGVNAAALWKTRLTNATLATLTTL
jgi:hypothetical protein